MCGNKSLKVERLNFLEVSSQQIMFGMSLMDSESLESIAAFKDEVQNCDISLKWR